MYPSRQAFEGVVLNLSELLLVCRDSHEPVPESGGNLFFEHVRLPFIATRFLRALSIME